MPMKSQRSSKIDPINTVGINELKSDLKRIVVITLVSIGLSFVTYRLDNCFKESLFCAVLSAVCTAIIGGLYFSCKKKIIKVNLPLYIKLIQVYTLNVETSIY